MWRNVDDNPMVPKGTVWYYRCHAWWRYLNNWYVIEYYSQGVCITKLNIPETDTEWSVYYNYNERPYDPYGSDISMAKEWIAAASKVKKDVCTKAAAFDNALFKGREALQEFMTEYTDAEDKPRSLSFLQIKCEGAVFSVGIKDPDNEAWIWRTGDTLQACLTAVEKAIREMDQWKVTDTTWRSRKKK